jgi:hypothetical protein
MSEDKKVPIRLTEEITASDGPAEIDRKRVALSASLARHGVAASDQTITEGWLGSSRALIGEGPGTPIEMTEEMEKRRKEANEAAAQKAMVAIAASLTPGSGLDLAGAGEAAAQLAEAQRLNAETKALIEKLTSAQAGQDPASGAAATELTEAQRLNAETRSLVDQMAAERKAIAEQLALMTAQTSNAPAVPLDDPSLNDAGPAATKVEKNKK